MKKLIWTTLAAIVSAGAAAFAMRVLDATWRRVAHEDPPAAPRWARFLVGMPLKRGVVKNIEPNSV